MIEGPGRPLRITYRFEFFVLFIYLFEKEELVHIVENMSTNTARSRNQAQHSAVPFCTTLASFKFDLIFF